MAFTRSRRTALLAAATLGLLGVPGLTTGATAAGAEPVPAAAAPAPSGPRAGRPTVVVAVGDSITQASGTGELTKENPKNSWATGNEVNSVAQRLGIAAGNRYNLSANGARMTNFAGQLRDGKSGGSGNVAPMPASTGLVVVEFGGNDLCRDTVADMTSVATYRAQFRAGLAQIRTQAPNALVQVMSVPDIYNLWYIRGGPKNATYHPENESDQANGLNGARFYWGRSFFPCQSLLAGADSYAAVDRQRRLDVRARAKAYNQVLSEECGAVLRCRFDGGFLFNLTSNRASGLDGPLKPQSQWTFVDNDISRNEGAGRFLCPVQGAVAGGCGDHFHPSKQGQGKVADAAVASGRTWSDTVFPTASAVIVSTPEPGVGHVGRATVRFGGSDAAGLRGQEVRVHGPDGSVSAWAPSLGVAPDKVITALGTSYVEVRSLDVNGNLSAGTVVSVTVVPAVAPGAPGTPAVTAGADGLRLGWTAPTSDGGAPVTAYRLETVVGPLPGTAGTPATVGAVTQAPAPDLAAGQVVRYRVLATNSAGTGPASALSEPTVAPFASLAAFVDRQYADFAGRAPTGVERSAAVQALQNGTGTPASVIESLRAAPYWDGAYGSTIRLYRAYFLRLPDPSGLDFWAARKREGRTLARISQQFAVSTEFQRTYGDLTDGEFIDAVYDNVFDRAPDPSGRDFYLRRLSAGWSRGQVVLQFSDSSEYQRLTEGLVVVVELARGTTGRAPNQALVGDVLAAYGTGGIDGRAAAVARLLGSAAYRTRVVG